MKIIYVYQKNLGMHGAHNTAYDLIETELNVCIDSDDAIPENAIQVILNTWQEEVHTESIAGIAGIDVFKDGEIVGAGIPKELKFSTYHDLYFKNKIRGDKKLVLKTEIVKKQPKYPIFEGEHLVPLGILYLMIDQQYQFACLNEPLCVVEYLQDGSSHTIFKQDKTNPKGFRYARIVELKYIKSVKVSILKVLYLISSTLFIGDYQFFKNNPKKIITFAFLPFCLWEYYFIYTSFLK